MKKTLSIILVEPENPDNIGAAARALKNMGFSDLRLVNPPKNWAKKAKKMAVSAADILETAQVFTAVSDAVADLQVVVGTTRRYGPKRGMFQPWEPMLKKIKKLSAKGGLGILFGKESKGLDNSALLLCDWLTTIPANPAYPSLNLAQAVLVTCYELSKFSKSDKTVYSTDMPFVPKEEVQKVLSWFRKALQALKYEEKGESKIEERIILTFHRLLKRGGLLDCEAQLFLGLSRRICEKTGAELPAGLKKDSTQA